MQRVVTKVIIRGRGRSLGPLEYRGVLEPAVRDGDAVVCQLLAGERRQQTEGPRGQVRPSTGV